MKSPRRSGPLSDAELSEDLSDLYETAPCGYLSVLPDGRIVKINGTLCTWIDRPAAELLGSSIHELLSFGGRIAYETHLAPLLRMQGHVYEIALDIVHRDGSKIPVIANAAEKRSPDGGHVFTRLTLFKAVDRRTYERSLLEARVRAEEASKAERETGALREQFIAVLGHDIRNPLSALAAGLTLLERREQLSAAGLDALGQMRASVGRAAALIDDVLDFARGRLGRGIDVDRNQDAPLAPVLEQVVAEVRMIAPERRIEAEVAIEEPVHCDRGRLGQLASNLLANALTHGAPDEPVRLEAHTGGGALTLSVVNHGPAIPEAVRGQLFQPFIRGAVRPSRNGLGLGLFIASEIARAHGGTLEATSSDAETRFTFVMPLGRDQQDANQ